MLFGQCCLEIFVMCLSVVEMEAFLEQNVAYKSQRFRHYSKSTFQVLDGLSLLVQVQPSSET